MDINVDAHQFDALTCWLSRAASSRRLFPFAIVALAALTDRRGALATDVVAEICLPNGQRCGRKSGLHGGRCPQCCSRYWTGHKRQRRCTCKPDETPCANPSQCCSGICDRGLCGAFCLPLRSRCNPRSDVCCGDGTACRHYRDEHPFACCVIAGRACATDTDCCQGACTGGRCED